MLYLEATKGFRMTLLRRYKKLERQNHYLALSVLAASLFLALATPIQAIVSHRNAENRAAALENFSEGVENSLSETRNLMKDFSKKKLFDELDSSRNETTTSSRDLSYWIADGKRYELKVITKKPRLPQKNKHNFAIGNCTYYLNRIYNINLTGNAIKWFEDAKQKGYETSAEPSVGDILVTSEGPNHIGHVAFVEKVSEKTIHISEMNFKGYGWITEREVPRDFSEIIGYIKGDQFEKRTERIDLIKTQLVNAKDAEKLLRE